MQIKTSEPLTRAQHSMWVGHQHHGSLPFHTAEWLVIEGPLNRELFHQAVTATLTEAKALHWRVVERNGKFYRQDDVPVREPDFIDLSALNEVALNQWLEQHVMPAFDPVQGHLYDYTFVHLDQQRYGMFLRAHHVALDGYAYGLLINRFIDYYQALCHQVDLKNKPFDHYSKFLVEEQQYLDSAQAEADLIFWKQNFSGELAPKKRLKRSLKEPFTQGYRFEDVIDLTTQQQLNTLASELKLPSAMIVMAVFMAYMIKQENHHQQCFGIPLLSRLGTSALRIPCLTMNIIPLRLDTTGSENLPEIVALLATRFTQIRPYQRCYFEQLRFVLEDFQPFENILFGPVVNWIPFPLPEHFEGCQLKKTTISAGPIEDFDMAISNKLVDGQERLYLAIDGHPELYTVQSLEHYWHDVMAMLKHWLDQPSLCLKDLNIRVPLPK
ncbi:condensation domain-containing protein [Acinetobacter puyangensis]|uniref:condensation domain-containing protein n=1 Tax=Acinetobacter puyangensis TaxID=1096779 RepID=UPI003A4D84EA